MLRAESDSADVAEGLCLVSATLARSASAVARRAADSAMSIPAKTSSGSAPPLPTPQCEYCQTSSRITGTHRW